VAKGKSLKKRAAPRPGAAAELREIACGRIVPNERQPRGPVDTASPDFVELAASVKARGVQVPILVRPHPDRGEAELYDLCYGARRLAAAVVAGLPTVPAIVREMDDCEFYETMAVENMDRDDLTPVQHGRAVALVCEQHADASGAVDYRAVAAAMGRSVRWVRTHERLGGLSERWVLKIADPATPYGRLGVGHLALLARFSAAAQDKILDDTGAHFWEKVTVAQLDEWLNNHYLRKLTGRPWARLGAEADAALVKDRPACESCSRRASRQGELFDDAVPEPMSRNDRCLDAACWVAKTAAWLKGRLTAARRKGKVVLITTEYLSDEQQAVLRAAKIGRPLSTWDWEAARKATPGSERAFVVAGPGTGKTRYVTLRAQASGARSAQPDKPPTLAKLRAGLDAEREKALTARLHREALGEGAVPYHGDWTPLKPAPPLLRLGALAAVFLGYDRRYDDGRGGGAEYCWDAYNRLIAEGEEAVRAALWHTLCESLSNDLLPTGTSWLPLDTVRDSNTELAALLGLDVEALRAEIAAERPEPAEWADLKRDGTPKAKRKGKKGKSKGETD